MSLKQNRQKKKEKGNTTSTPDGLCCYYTHAKRGLCGSGFSYFGLGNAQNPVLTHKQALSGALGHEARPAGAMPRLQGLVRAASHTSPTGSIARAQLRPLIPNPIHQCVIGPLFVFLCISGVDMGKLTIIQRKLYISVAGAFCFVSFFFLSVNHVGKKTN